MFREDRLHKHLSFINLYDINSRLYTNACFSNILKMFILVAFGIYSFSLTATRFIISQYSCALHVSLKSCCALIISLHVSEFG